MALKCSFFSIFFVLVLLVFPQVLAREMVKEQGPKDVNVKEGKALRSYGYPSPSVGCETWCGYECCPDAEYSESGKKVVVDKADRFNGDEQEGHGVAGAGHGRNGGGRS